MPAKFLTASDINTLENIESGPNYNAFVAQLAAQYGVTPEAVEADLSLHNKQANEYGYQAAAGAAARAKDPAEVGDVQHQYQDATGIGYNDQQPQHRIVGGKTYTTYVGNTPRSQQIQLPNGEWVIPETYPYYVQKDIGSIAVPLAMGLVGATGAGLFDSALGIGSSLPGELGGTIGSEVASGGLGGDLGFVDPIATDPMAFGSTNLPPVTVTEFTPPVGGLGGNSGSNVVGAAEDVTSAETFTGGLGSASGASTTPPGGGSALSRLLSGNATPSDLISLAGTVGGAALGAAGANAQGDAYRDVASQYLNIGAPFRSMLLNSYQPGFDIWSQPNYKAALDTSWDVGLRKASAGAGNPIENPGVMGELNKSIMGQLGLPAISNYRGQLGQFGGLGLNTSGQASMAGAGQEGGFYDALGFGLAGLTQPQNSIEDLLKKLGGAGSYTINVKGGA